MGDQILARGSKFSTSDLRAQAAFTLGVDISMSSASRVVGMVKGDTVAQSFYDFQVLPAALEVLENKTGAFTAFDTYGETFQARRKFRRSILVLKETRVRWVIGRLVYPGGCEHDI